MNSYIPGGFWGPDRPHRTLLLPSFLPSPPSSLLACLCMYTDGYLMISVHAAHSDTELFVSLILKSEKSVTCGLFYILFRQELNGWRFKSYSVSLSLKVKIKTSWVLQHKFCTHSHSSHQYLLSIYSGPGTVLSFKKTKMWSQSGTNSQTLDLGKNNKQDFVILSEKSSK